MSTLKPVCHGAEMGLQLPNRKVSQDGCAHQYPMLAPGTSLSTVPGGCQRQRSSQASQWCSASGSTTCLLNSKGVWFFSISSRQASPRPVEGSFCTRHRLAESTCTLGCWGHRKATKPPCEAGSPSRSLSDALHETSSHGDEAWQGTLWAGCDTNCKYFASLQMLFQVKHKLANLVWHRAKAAADSFFACGKTSLKYSHRMILLHRPACSYC